jgi:hypothetical protein
MDHAAQERQQPHLVPAHKRSQEATRHLPWLMTDSSLKRALKDQSMLPGKFFKRIHETHPVGGHLAHHLGPVHAMQGFD